MLCYSTSKIHNTSMFFFVFLRCVFVHTLEVCSTHLTHITSITVRTSSYSVSNGVM